MQSIDFRGCRFEFDREAEYCQTVFADGKVAPASPEDTVDYRKRARELGYGDDIVQMCFDHELIHNLLADVRGVDFSPVLRHVADGQSDLSDMEIGAEEEAVMTFQKRLMSVRINASEGEHQARRG